MVLQYTTNMTKTIKAAAENAGILLPSRKKWHIFRCTFASMFLQHGGDVESLRVQGNWKDYSHAAVVCPNQVAKRLEKVS